MDHDELLRLRGEQVTIERELREVSAQLNGERQALLALVNRLPMLNAEEDWLDGERARLQRIRDLQLSISDIRRKLAALKQVTGL